MSINRREFCYGAATVALAVTLGAMALPPWPARAEDDIPQAELMKSQALPDLVLGSDTASVTVVEYASMTCPHCAHFNEKTFPEFKKKYIDTGKVRYMLREFPLDPLAAAGFMLARCAGETDKNRYYAMVDTLFRQQSTWVVQQPLPHLLNIAKQAGFTKESFDACLANQKLLDDIQAERQRAIDAYKVQSTPTFFINGVRHVGALTMEDISKAVDSYLKG